MKIALVYNGVTRDMLLQGPLDRTAEFDGPHTVATLHEALAVHGHAVTLIEANEEAYERLRTSGVDLVFNVAEGTHGADREAQIPAMLEMLGMPYTGSGPLSLALCLHKGKTKEILVVSWYSHPGFSGITASARALVRGARVPPHRQTPPRRIEYGVVVRLHCRNPSSVSSPRHVSHADLWPTCVSRTVH